MSDVKSILDRIIKCAKGAALMTETEVEVKVEHGCCEFYPNKKYADLTYNVMKEIPLPVYTANELQYAAHLQTTIAPAAVKAEADTYGALEILHSSLAPRDIGKKIRMNASSDSGDVSYMMPMNLFTVAGWPFGVAPHTWQASACAGGSIGAKATVYAAKVIAATGYELLTNPAKAEEIIAEFKAANVEYVPMYND